MAILRARAHKLTVWVGGLRLRAEDGRQPGHIPGAPAAHDIVIDLSHLVGDWPNKPSAHQTMIYRDDGGDLRTGARQEDLVGTIQLVAVHDARARDAVQLPPRQLHACVARHAQAYVL